MKYNLNLEEQALRGCQRSGNKITDFLSEEPFDAQTRAPVAINPSSSLPFAIYLQTHSLGTKSWILSLDLATCLLTSLVLPVAPLKYLGG